MDNIFYRVLLNDRIKIEPRYLSKDYRNYVASKLKERMEGICTKHGYIKPGTVELYKIAPGSIELIGLNGNIVFEVYYYAEVCNPLIGNVFKATVTNVNKFGILAEVGNILEIIIAKNSVNIVHDSAVNLDTIQIGSQVLVEVIGKKFELNDKKISIVGKIVSTPSGSTKSKKKQEVTVNAPDNDEEEEVEDIDNVAADGSDAEDEEDADDEDNDDEDETILEDEDNDEEMPKETNDFFDSEDEVDDNYEFYSEKSFSDGDAEEDAGNDFE